MKKQMTKKTKIALIIILPLLFGVFLGSIDEDSSTQDIRTKTILKIGDDGMLSNQGEKTNCEGNTVLGTSKENYDEFTEIQVVDDRSGYLQMLGNGKLLPVANCTKVKVIDTTFALREVQMLEGEHVGVSGWVPVEFVISE